MSFGLFPFGDRPFGDLSESGTSFVVLHGRASLTVTFDYAIYAASRSFLTGDDDVPADTYFSGTLAQPLSFKRSAISGDGFSGFVEGQGELVVNNGDGFYDFLPEFYALDGRGLEVRYGRDSDDYRTWFTIFKGTASDFHVDETELRVDLQDFGYKLEIPLTESTYSGSGGVNGGDDLEGKRKPLCYGYCSNITPVLVQSTKQLYQVNDGPVQAISAVYANGVALDFDQDYGTAAALLAAAIPSGDFATCLACGLFRINFLLDGDVITCDAEGDNSGSGFVSTQGQVIRRIVANLSALTDPDDFYVPAFDKFETAQPFEVGYYADHNDTSTVSETVTRIMGYGGTIGFRRNGKLEIKVFEAPGPVPAMRFDETEIVDIRRERLPDNLTPPPYKWRVGYARNWTVQDELAGAVGDERRAFLAEEVRYAVAESAAVKVNHPFAQERDPVGGYFRNEEDAQGLADRLLALHADSASLYRLTLGTRPFSLEISDTITVTFPRFDLTTGRNLRVVEISENASSNAIEIVGFG
ncbi:hypothetical protein [Rhodobium gokarnense]|uniref:Tail protein n=1 Tax=Rhodobium gokarnense TaxID=364296 RepID=A0ABT3HH76_9HYPH|nr:hypothetical protein [Rhodobium gokarnense]MCW2309748.1 hypothetical protein [Rhodobium gokarnense]